MTLSEQFIDIKERIERTGIGVKDALSVIDMTFEDQIKRLEASSPYDAFSELNTLIDRTAHGTKIERFGPRDDCRHFHTLEIHTEEGEILGYLNMLYLNKAIPCYYLVYVEVMPSFRGLGLGNRILTAYMEFLKDKKAVGLLDNIIPPDEPTYEIYNKLGWKALTDVVENAISDGWENYMIFVPACLETDTFRENLVRILFSLKKKRAIIDMHDNEDMVKRTIEEFRSVYQALIQLFNQELLSDNSNPLMRFMFTRLTTKLIGFKRRIAALIGYTGGESLEQIIFSEQIKSLPVQPYSMWSLEQDEEGVWGDGDILRKLPPELKEEPTFFIESLPLYNRPYLRNWTKNQKHCEAACGQSLTVGDLIDLGFDPTRLREFHHEGEKYIFERISPHFFSSLIKKRAFLKKLERSMAGQRFHGTSILINQLLLIFRDRGNIYALRKKVDGIHSLEALDQLKTVACLTDMNCNAKVDSVMIRVMNDTRDWLKKKFHSSHRQEIEDLTYFFPWDMETNFPKIEVDFYGVSFGSLWLA